ncbi:TPA: hypothetical protein ENG04_10015 [Candidatus Poribacteria bacterium]|nr:hypothetical protein [Candidatus Poribacteria bacterium]HEX30403.1 hypothetical protein [Candidatus Poribacteria bacterium]
MDVMNREIYIEAAKSEILALARTYPVVAAFVCGSTVYEAEPRETDVDVRVVLDGEPVPGFLVERDGVPIEVTFTSLRNFLDEEQILSHPVLPSDILRGRIIYDPTGMLSELKERIGRRYGERRYIAARARKMFEEALEVTMRAQRDFEREGRIPLWTFRGALFRAGEVPLILLDMPLTHRRLFLFLREAAYRMGDDEIHGLGLETLGSSGMSKAEVLRALDETMAIFDIQEEVSHFYLSPLKRRYWERGTLMMTEEGLYAEAVWPLFTLVSLYCMDDPTKAKRFWLLDRLSFNSYESCRRKFVWMKGWLDRIGSHLGGTFTTLSGGTNGLSFFRSTIRGFE